LIPVVLITALGDTDSRIKGMGSGADDFITKPVIRKALKVMKSLWNSKTENRQGTKPG